MDKPKCWFKNVVKIFTVESESQRNIFLTQHLGLSIGSNNPALFRVKYKDKDVWIIL